MGTTQIKWHSGKWIREQLVVQKCKRWSYNTHSTFCAIVDLRRSYLRCNPRYWISMKAKVTFIIVHCTLFLKNFLYVFSFKDGELLYQMLMNKHLELRIILYNCPFPPFSFIWICLKVADCPGAYFAGTNYCLLCRHRLYSVTKKR